MTLADPRFPPLLAGHVAREGADPAVEAARRAAAGELGAGDLVWSRDSARAACALVLEPDVALAACCQMFALGAVAAGEALGHLCPPQVAVEFRWPGTLLVNGAAAGRVRVLSPEGAREAVPRHLVLAIEIDLAADARGELGEMPERTALAEEGAAHVTRTDVIAVVSKLLLAWLHTWSADGFRPIREPWLFRAEGRTREVEIEGRRGRVAGLDEDGNLMLAGADGRVVSIACLPHVEFVA
jgi:biotin-(acetyl-CoA carboxylase) ligase